MAYTFDPAAGSTFAQLQELVLTNTFSSSRYSELVKTWLNDAVMDACRRLDLLKGYEVLAVTDGVVAQATQPFYRVDEVWTASGPAASGELAMRQQAVRWLEPIPYDSPVLVGGVGNTTPWGYSLRRATTTGRYPTLKITLHPEGAGYAAIAGRQRPAIMDADADTTGLDSELDDALVAFAKARCFRNEDDFELAASWEGEYMKRLGSITPPQSGPIVTPGTWERTTPRPGGY